MIKSDNSIEMEKWRILCVELEATRFKGYPWTD